MGFWIGKDDEIVSFVLAWMDLGSDILYIKFFLLFFYLI